MEPWFGDGLRTSMAVKVEEIVHGTVLRRRKCFYDEDGRDVRLSTPGVRWADLRQIRTNVLESLRNNCQEAFEKVYEQILAGRRTTMTPSDNTAGSDSGVCSERSKDDREWRQRRSGSSLGGKRLRSASLEKLSISEIETKRMSPPVESNDAPDGVVTGGDDDGSSLGGKRLRSVSLEKLSISEIETKRMSPPVESNDTPDSVVTGGDDDGSSLGGKRLRSVSLEKLSISEIETKRMSPPVESNDTPDSVVTGGDDDGSSLGGKRLRSVSLEKLSISEIETKRMSPPVESNDTPDGVVTGTGGDDDGSSLGGKRLRSVSLEKLSISEIETKRMSPPVESNDTPDGVVTGTGGDDDGSSLGGKRLRSVSLEKLSISEIETKRMSPPVESNDTPDGVVTGGDEGVPLFASSPGTEDGKKVEDSGFKRSPVLNLKKTKGSPWSFLSKKGVPLKLTLPSEGRPATFLSPTSCPRRLEDSGKPMINGTTLPISFLPRNSPQQIQKAESRAARQRKLLERMQRKKEEDEQRKRHLEEKRMQEIEQRKRHNAERAQRAAENRRQEEEKKLMLRKKAQVQELVFEELFKKQQKLKANERKEKTKKRNEHVAAVLARKKQEEEQKTKKLQQIEEDRKMAEELHKQRLEKETVNMQTSADPNCTFTKGASTAEEKTKHQIFVTPLKTATSKCPPNEDSYKMTPAEPVSTNYDINDLSSGDSTDEEDRPKKPIPVWAITSHLKAIMICQEEKVYNHSVDPCDIFPSKELLGDVDLARIFKQKRKRFYHRSSSACWDPCLLKKGKIGLV